MGPTVRIRLLHLYKKKVFVLGWEIAKVLFIINNFLLLLFLGELSFYFLRRLHKTEI